MDREKRETEGERERWREIKGKGGNRRVEGRGGGGGKKEGGKKGRRQRLERDRERSGEQESLKNIS